MVYLYDIIKQNKGDKDAIKQELTRLGQYAWASKEWNLMTGIGSRVTYRARRPTNVTEAEWRAELAEQEESHRRDMALQELVCPDGVPDTYAWLLKLISQDSVEQGSPLTWTQLKRSALNMEVCITHSNPEFDVAWNVFRRLHSVHQTLLNALSSDPSVVNKDKEKMTNLVAWVSLLFQRTNLTYTAAALSQEALAALVTDMACSPGHAVSLLTLFATVGRDGKHHSLFEHCTPHFAKTYDGDRDDVVQLIRDIRTMLWQQRAPGVAYPGITPRTPLFESRNQIQELHDHLSFEKEQEAIRNAELHTYTYSDELWRITQEINSAVALDCQVRWPISSWAIRQRGANHHNCLGSYVNRHENNVRETDYDYGVANIHRGHGANSLTRILFSDEWTAELVFHSTDGATITSLDIRQVRGMRNRAYSEVTALSELRTRLVDQPFSILNVGQQVVKGSEAYEAMRD